MSPKQYRDAIAKLGMNQREAGRWLGVSYNTAHHYPSGKTRVPEPVAKLLRLVIKKQIDPKEVA